MEDKKENLPKRKMPEFELRDEQINELKTVSAVTKMLADNPQVMKEIADIFEDIEMQKQRELIEKVTNLLAEKVTGVSAENIQAAFNYWYLLPGQWVHSRPWITSPPTCRMRTMGQWIH